MTIPADDYKLLKSRNSRKVDQLNLGIIQLSDLHIASEEAPILSRIAAIKSAVQSRINGECAFILAYTGDIAFSGVKPEYEVAYRFLRQLRDRLEEIPNVKILGTAIIPGNHDCLSVTPISFPLNCETCLNHGQTYIGREWTRVNLCFSLKKGFSSK